MADMIGKIKSSLDVIPRVISDLESKNHVLFKFGIPITSEFIKQLKEIKEKLEFFKYKFEKDIIEVAFVGLEKAGKSTLVNSILGENILPSDYKRATYTTTQVEYAPDRYLEIFFYSEEEFLDEVYRKMLKEVEYPNYHSQTLDSVSSSDFEKYFESLKNNNRHIYDKYKGNLENDIKDIIDGRNKIKSFLRGSKERISFSRADEYRDYIVDKYISRAVKEIKIYTDVLKGLENVIIYDLPGFDSPTFIHSKFTKEKIRRADAVVFVREAENPSIRRAEVEIINETREEDGTLLKDKAFFFCNMVDKIPNRKDLERVERDFENELRTYDIYKKQERIIYGSALARLQVQGKSEESNAINGLRNLDLTDGIDTLLERLKEYNKTERREVLYKRVNHLLYELENAVRSLVEALEKKKRQSSASKVFASKLREIEEKAKKSILDKVSDFHEKIKELNRTKALSQKISKTIRENLIFDNLVSDEDRKLVQRDVNLETSTFERRPDKYNHNLRSRLYGLVLERFTKTIEESVREGLFGVSDGLKKIFVEALNISSRNKEKFLEILEQSFKETGVNFSYEAIGLNKFIERFGGDLIQLLITNPVGSTDREGKFKEIERDIYSLMAYDEDFIPDTPVAYKHIKSRLLYQSEDFVQQVMSFLNEVLGLKKVHSSEEDKHKLALQLLYKFSSFNAIKELLEKIKNNNAIKTYEDVVKYILNTSPDFIYEEEPVQIKRPTTYEEVEEEISRDVDILKTMLEKNVIRAIGLEKMIVNHITSQIQTITGWVRSADFYNFINENVSTIAEDIEAEAAMLSTYEGLVSSLTERLNELLRTLLSGK